MDLLKEKYDRVILVLVALVTIVFAVLLIMKANGFAGNFTLQQVTQRSDLPETQEPFVVASTGMLVGDDIKWSPPVLDSGKKPALFLAVPTVLKDGELIDMSEEDPLLRPPVSNAWLTANGVEFLRQDILEQDPDKDGFSILEEWNNAHIEGNTAFDPMDPKDHPSFLLKLSLVKQESEDYTLTFKSSMGADFSVEWKAFGETRSNNKFVKIGDRFADDRFLVEEMVPVEKEEGGIKRNRSILKVKDSVSGQTLDLVMGIPYPLPTYFAIFKFDLDDAPEFRVKQGVTFKLPSADDTTYKLIEVKEESADIENVPAIGEPPAVRTTVQKKGAP